MDLIFATSLLCPGVLLIGGVLLLVRLTQKDKPPRLWILIPVGLASIFAAIFFFLVVYDSSGFIRFIFVGSLVIMTGLSVIIISIAQGLHLQHYFGRNNLILYFAGVILVITSSFIGWVGSSAIVNQCERSHLDTGNIIVNALENYYRDNKQYPENLSELVPNYIRTNSVSTCYSLRWKQRDSSIMSQFDGFYYKKCSKGVTQLSIPEMGSGHFHIYDLSGKKWYTSGGDTLEEWGRVTLCQNY